MLNFVVLFHHNYQVQVALIIIGQVFYLNVLHWIVFPLILFFSIYINLCHAIELMWLEVESERHAQCDMDKVLFIRAAWKWIRVQHPGATSTAQAYLLAVMAVHSYF